MTVFAGGAATLSLGVAVPGGQQVYVAADGALGFTPPHSGAVPEGAALTGFSEEKGAGEGALGHLSWGRGFVACPHDGTPANATVWKVYGTKKGSKVSKDCLGFDFLTSSAKEVGAWEYT
ncbi:MAG: hypothetical protein INR71_04845 [Terriglobus roseus]|nr:hypothetical protein [Terriglobus roseus]